MGGHDNGAAYGQASQAGEHVGFGGGVEVARGFVQQQQGGVLQEGAGDGDALGLAAGYAMAAFADAGEEAGGKAGREFGDAGLAGGFLNLGGGGLGAGEADVVQDGAGEEGWLLADPGGELVQRLGDDVGDVGAVQEDAAGVGADEAEQELDDGGFAGAGGTGEDEDLAGGDDEAQAVQGGAA